VLMEKRANGMIFQKIIAYSLLLKLIRLRYFMGKELE
jgi:hypothetical protein